MATKRKIPETWRRGRAIRTDATVATALREIQNHFDLPDGAVQINLPDGRKARRDKRISALLRDWK